jgi:hypothetical protein
MAKYFVMSVMVAILLASLTGKHQAGNLVHGEA